MYATTSLNTGR